METRYLASLVGIMHVACLWWATLSQQKDPENTSAPDIVWAPCALGTAFFLVALSVLVPVVREVVGSLWLFLFLLELAHCSEVSYHSDVLPVAELMFLTACMSLVVDAKIEATSGSSNWDANHFSTHAFLHAATQCIDMGLGNIQHNHSRDTDVRRALHVSKITQLVRHWDICWSDHCHYFGLDYNSLDYSKLS